MNENKALDIYPLNGIEAFQQTVIEELKHIYGDDYRILPMDKTKNNGIILHGINICHKDSNISPTIYLDNFFKGYNEGELTIQRIASIIEDTYSEHKVTDKINMSFLNDFNTIKDKITFRLVGKTANEDMLQTVPHKDFLDMVLVFYINLCRDDLGTASIQVTNILLDMWDVGIEELLQTAVANSHNGGIIIESLLDLMLSSNLVSEEFGCLEDVNMYVMTNPEKLHGAVAMYYSDKLQETAERFNSNLYILPSSVHEILIVPETKGMSPEYLQEIVKEVNRTQVSPEEVLTDSVYYYDRDSKELTISVR